MLVLQAVCLDIRCAKTHTGFMLTCRLGALLRTLTLVGVILLCVGVVGRVEAETAQTGAIFPVMGSKESTYIVFPYLSPSSDQRAIIRNAFTVQMRLFGAVGGDDNVSFGIKALFYLSLAAILVGGLMVIFNPKNRSMAIMGPWLLIVIITMFSPYGSKMLFYPIAKDGEIKNAFNQEDIPISECSVSAVNCGFTPQLVALHVASVLQLSISDIFNSIGWKGVIEAIQAKVDLDSNKNLVPSGDALSKANRFREQCGERIAGWNNLMAYRVALGQNAVTGEGAASFGGSNKQVAFELGKELNSVFDDIANGLDGKRHVNPPRAYVLYGDADYPEEAWGSDSTALNRYTNGLRLLYEAYTGKVNTTIARNGANGALSFDEVLTELDENKFFNAGVTSCWKSNCAILPGFFLTWSGATKSGKGDDSAAAYRTCYYTPSVDTPTPNQICEEGFAMWNMWKFSNQAEYLKGLTSPSRDNGFSYTVWDRFSNVFGNPEARVVLDSMPVGVIDYYSPEVNASNLSAPKPIKEGGRPVIDCLSWGNMLMDERVDYVFGQAGTLKNLEKLRILLKDKREIPSGQELTLKDIYQDGLNCANGQYDHHGTPNCETDTTGKNEAAAILTRFKQDEIAAAAAKAKVTQQDGTLTPAERYKVLFNTVMSPMDEISRYLRGNTRGEEQATEDSRAVEIVGNNAITSVGGWGSKFFGKMLAQIGAFFTGPLAVGIVFFMSILVDMALLALIVMTPILFFIALAMPGNAMGVLTIAVVGVFVLKVVPVTLLLMNNLAGMIMVMIGSLDADERVTMENLLVIAMAGLYANVIGLTFFLLFKMGDASAVLGRFAALDSSAKQLGEAGLNATKAALALAALPAAGFLAGGLGARAAASAALRAGAPPELVNLVRAGQKAAEDKNPDGGGDGYTPEEQARIDANQEGIANAMKPISEGGLGLSESEAKDLFARPDKSVTADDGRIFSLGADGKPIWTAGGESASKLEHNVVKNLSGPELYKEQDRAADHIAAMKEEQQIQASEDAKLGELTGTESPDGSSGTGGPSTPGIGTTGAPGAGTPGIGTAGAPGAAGSAAGIAANVTVAGGSLDSVKTIDSMGADSKAPETEQEKIANKIAERDIEKKVDAQEKAQALLKRFQESDNTPDNVKEKLKNVNMTDGEKAQQEIHKILREAGSSAALVDAKDARSHNLYQQYAKMCLDFEEQNAETLASIAKKEQTGEKLTNYEKYVQDTQKKILAQDPAGLVLGEQAKALGNVERLMASVAARSGADKAPSMLQGALSGVYGGIAGGGGGLAKIPVIGPAIAEALNEYHQAPERARAMKSVGGLGNWWQAQGDAKRMAFYQKEMAPLAAAQQYSQMSMVGGFQAQADIARQAASIAVAKSRSEWEGMLADRKGVMLANDPDLEKRLRSELEVKISEKSIKELHPSASSERMRELRESQIQLELQNQLNNKALQSGSLVMSSSDLSGLGRHEVAARIQALRGEANVAQYASLQVQTLKGGLNADMMMGSTKLSDFETKKHNVFLTPDMLATLHGNLGVKSSAKKNDELMLANYGILEKQYLRADKDWDGTRGMAFKREAAGLFANSDVSTDYLVGGHLSMVQGKERFFESRGQYQSLVKYRHESNAMVAEYMKQQLQQVDSGMKDAIAKIGASGKPSEWTAEHRTKLEKWAKDEMKDKGITIPLEAVFDVSMTNGKAKYDRKVMTAVYEQASQDAENWGAMQKAAASSLAAKLPDVRNFSKKISFESGGVKFDIGSATEKLFEKMDMALQGRATEAIKVFNEYFSKPGRQQSAFDIKIDKSNKRNPHGWMRVNADEFENYLQALDKQSPGQGEKIRAKIDDGKTFRRVGNTIEWGYLSQKEEF